MIKDNKEEENKTETLSYSKNINNHSFNVHRLEDRIDEINLLFECSWLYNGVNMFL